MSVCKDVPIHTGLYSGSSAGTETATDREAIRVWLVDDSNNYRLLMASLLNEEGFDCSREFPCAEAALEALKEGPPPDVFLLDVRMPGIGGLNAVRPIRSLAGATHVLMLTTFYDSYAKEQALSDGASGLLLKSYPLAEICQTIRQTVAHSPPVLARPGPENFGAPDGAPSRWPKRRAPALNHGRSNDDATSPHPDEGHRTAPWRWSSSRLARGVHLLRELLGHKPRQPAES